MAAPTRTPRSKWIEQGLRALAAGGRMPSGSSRWPRPSA